MFAEDVRVPHGDLALESYLAYPEGGGSYPGVIVLQEVFGVNDHIREVTRRVAAAGFVAIAPAIYQRSAPGFTADYNEAGLALGRKYKEQTKATELLGDLQATIAYLQGLPMVMGARVGLMGFCFGGHVAYLGATLPAIAATASFYGAGIATFCPGEEQPTITRTHAIQGKIICFFGEEDELIPLEQVAQIEGALQGQGVAHELVCYGGAGHGFFCDRRPSYRPEAAEDAWRRTIQLFQECLCPS